MGGEEGEGERWEERRGDMGGERGGGGREGGRGEEVSGRVRGREGISSSV